MKDEVIDILMGKISSFYFWQRQEKTIEEKAVERGFTLFKDALPPFDTHKHMTSERVSVIDLSGKVRHNFVVCYGKIKPDYDIYIGPDAEIQLIGWKKQ